MERLKVRGLVLRLMCTALVVCVSSHAGAARIIGNRIELLPNEGFEDAGIGRGTQEHLGNWFGWSGWSADTMQIVADRTAAHAGRRSLRWKGKEGGDKGAWLTMGVLHKGDGLTSWHGGKNITYVPVFRGTKYIFSFWARGSGEIEPWTVLGSYVRFVPGEVARERITLTPEWRHYRYDFELTPTKWANHVRPALCYFGKEGDVTWIDDVSFSCEATERNRAHYFPRQTFSGVARAKGARVGVFVNALPIGSGKLSSEVELGLNHIVVEVTPENVGRAVEVQASFTIGNETLPVGDGTWMMTGSRQEAFRMDAYDPKKWQPVPASEKLDSVLLPPETLAEGPLYLRRSLYRGDMHDIFLWPDQKEFHIAEGSVTILMMHMRRMVELPPNRPVKIEIEAPLQLKLLDKKGGKPCSFWSNKIPVKIEAKDVVRDGRRCVLHTFTSRAKEWYETLRGTGLNTHFNTLVLYFTFPRPVADNQDRRIRIRRVFWDGSLTEQWKEMKVVFLPKVRGGRPKRFRFSMRARELWYVLYAQRPAMRHSKAERYAGIKAWQDVGPCIFWHTKRGPDPEYLKAIADVGGGYTLPRWSPGYYRDAYWNSYFDEFPEYRQVDYRGTADSLREGGLIEHHVRYIMYGSGRKRCYRGMCLTHLAEGGQKAWRRYSLYLDELKKTWPKASFVHEEASTEIFGSTCFCDLCKRAFEKHSGIKGAAKMSDDEIVSKHLKKWCEFGLHQVRQVRLKMRERLNARGIIYFVHDEGRQYMGGVDVSPPLMGACDVKDAQFNPTPWMVRSLAPWGPLSKEQGMSAVQELVRLAGETGTALGGSVYGWYGDEPRQWRNMTLRAAAAGRSGIFKWETNAVVPSSGGLWYLAEAVRAIERYEDDLIRGERIDNRLSVDNPELEMIAFRLPDHVLAIIFNDDRKDVRCTLSWNEEVGTLCRAEVYEEKPRTGKGKLKLTVPETGFAIIRLTPVD